MNIVWLKVTLKLSDSSKLMIFNVGQRLFGFIHTQHFVVFLSVTVWNGCPQANDTVKVNSVQVPEADMMATNGVIHFVNKLLYPEGKTFIQLLSYKSAKKRDNCKYLIAVNALCCLVEIPIGSQELQMVLTKLISYIQFKVNLFFVFKVPEMLGWV